MIPRQPPRRTQLGFVYLPPYRIQGISVAGEESALQIPELDLGFDIGVCPKPLLSSNYLALSHGHMDHSACLAYYFSQRQFQGMGTGTVVCHPRLEQPIHNLMNAWVDVESQRTPYRLIALEQDQQIEIKNHIHLRGFETRHTVPSLGYVVIEKRSKLKPEFFGLPQEKLVELKRQGTAITHTLEIPLIAYLGDTAWGEHFNREDVRQANVLITECTFVDPGDQNRAAVGKHMHLSHIVNLLERSQAQAIVLTHISRRTHIKQARTMIDKYVPDEHKHRLFLLMDSRANRQRYDQQLNDAAAQDQRQVS